MIKKYRGKAEKNQYFSDLADVPGGTLSPGGAVQLLRISRQFVDKLMQLDEIHAWALYEGIIPRATYIEISARDLIAYGVRVGRIKSIADLGLGFPLGQEEIDIINQNKG